MGYTGTGVADVFDLTLSTPAEAVDDNDVLADTQEIVNVFMRPHALGLLKSIEVIDQDDQANEMDIVFLDSNVSLGTEDSAVSITDANAAHIIGIINVPAANYIDLIGSQVAFVKNIDLLLKGGASTSLFVGVITRGTPTHTASGLKLKIGMDLYA